MAKQLSQAEIDALLSSLRQAQEDADAAAGVSGWQGLSRALASGVMELLAAAWRRHVPGLTLLRAGQPPERGVPTAVARVGGPDGARLWFYWAGAGPEAPTVVATFLEALAGPDVEMLAPETPPPSEALLLPLRGMGATGTLSLTIAVEPATVAFLEARLPVKPAADGAAPAGHPAPTVSIRDLEVEASVYVGGGLYRLAELAALRPGAVLPLATEVGEPAVIAIQGRVIAYGEVMVTPDDTLAIRLTRVVLGEEGRLAAPAWLEQARRLPGAPRGGLPPAAR